MKITHSHRATAATGPTKASIIRHGAERWGKIKNPWEKMTPIFISRNIDKGCLLE